MSFLFIGSTGDHAGHSLTAWAIARSLVEQGLRVGFIKPFGTHPVNIEGIWSDYDAFLFKNVLDLQEPIDRICPYLLTEEACKQNMSGEIIEEIISIAQEFSVEKDILIIMGSEHIFFDDSSQPVPDISLINELNADFVLVNRYRDTSRSIYSILSVSSLLKERVKGIIINRVPPERLEEARNKLIPSLIQKGIPITTALPEDPVLSFWSLREIKDVLNGELLWGEESLGRSVGGMTVGSADLTGGLLLFKRAYNKIVLLEPASLDSEIDQPSAKRPVAGILLTGGRNPAPRLLEAAKMANTPLMLVKEDTFAALESLEHTSAPLSAKDEQKVRYFTELMDSEGAFDRLFQSLGLRIV